MANKTETGKRDERRDEGERGGRMTIPANLLTEVKDFRQLNERLETISREYHVPEELCRQVWLLNLTRNIGVMSGHSLDRVIARSTEDTAHYVAGWTSGAGFGEIGNKRRAS